MGTSKNRLGEAVLTSTHNLCFGAKQEKWVYPCIPHFYCIKVGVTGVLIARACFPDALIFMGGLEDVFASGYCFSLTCLFICTRGMEWVTHNAILSEVEMKKLSFLLYHLFY